MLRLFRFDCGSNGDSDLATLLIRAPRTMTRDAIEQAIHDDDSRVQIVKRIK